LVAASRFATLVALLGLLSALVAPAAFAAPPPPAVVPTGIEAYQPYVGQKVCDPVAKPGVRSFMNMVLEAYPGTGSSGIVRDCGIGGTSEHKEGRAWDWTANYSNTTQRAQAANLLTWLLATDKYGNKHAMLRRLGVMYMIWNKQIWKAYQADKGWQAYSGSDPHTSHAHFSFGWNGAKQATSYWSGRVAPVDYGPTGSSSISPVVSPANLPILAQYGQLTLKYGSSGEAVKVIQRPLQVAVDGAYGSGTAAAVSAFQRAQGLTATGTFGPTEWKRLFPPPVTPFGKLEFVDPAMGPTMVTGWAIDADKDVPLDIEVWVDKVLVKVVREDVNRSDITATYKNYPAPHGFRVTLPMTDGSHYVCARARNVAGTPGSSTSALGCITTTVQHSPIGRLDSVQQRPEGIIARGWALDPDRADPLAVRLTIDGELVPASTTASVSRPDLLRRYPAYGDAHGLVTSITAAQGLRSVCLTALNVVGTKGADRSLGCRSLTVWHDPIGVLDPIKSTLGKVIVAGRSLDPDSSAASSVQIRVDGQTVSTIAANQAGSVPNYSVYGGSRGFRTELTLAQGVREVCSYGLNVTGTPGANSLLGCQRVTVNHLPIGSFESFRQVPGGNSMIRGWAADPDTATAIKVRVTVDGVVKPELTANASRSDIGTRYPDLGANHGYSASYSLADGSHQVCVTNVNATGTPGANTAAACRTLIVRHSPVGSLPTFTRVPAGVIVKGWALDLDSTSPVAVRVLVDGVQKAALTANLTRADVATAYPGYGTAHGYATAALNLTQGTHKVCVTGINVSGTSGKNAQLACRDVAVNHNPVGRFDPVTFHASEISASGWALDLDSTKAVIVRISVDGKHKAQMTANLSRGDLTGRYPGYGTSRGWHVHFTTSRGTHNVCARAYNVLETPGVSTSLGCRSITF